MTVLEVRPLASADWAALEDLFGPAGASNGCWCAYWRLGPRYRDRDREDNRRDLLLLAESGRSPGLLAFGADGTAVGWCLLAPRGDLGWLAHARYLAPVDDLPVWSVPCFYVRRAHRGQGVPDALLETAIGVAASAGAPALEGYPVDTDVPGHTRNAFTGTALVFARHGFQVVARRKPDRPVMRLSLALPAAPGWLATRAAVGRPQAAARRATGVKGTRRTGWITWPDQACSMGR
jgi:GNAT superfamily N-acetyltransferase